MCRNLAKLEVFINNKICTDTLMPTVLLIHLLTYLVGEEYVFLLHFNVLLLLF